MMRVSVQEPGPSFESSHQGAARAWQETVLDLKSEDLNLECCPREFRGLPSSVTNCVLCRGAAGNPRVPRLLPGTLGNFPGCLCQPSPWVGPGKPNLPLGLRGKAGGGARLHSHLHGTDSLRTPSAPLLGACLCPTPEGTPQLLSLRSRAYKH